MPVRAPVNRWPRPPLLQNSCCLWTFFFALLLNDPRSVCPSTRPLTSLTSPRGASIFSRSARMGPGDDGPPSRASTPDHLASSILQVRNPSLPPPQPRSSSLLALRDRSVALPFMNVTRLEYDPISIGVRSVSAAITRTLPSGNPALGHNLRDHRVRSLPNIRRACIHDHAAIAINLDVHR